MNLQYINLSKKGSVLLVEMNRPQALNALNTELLKELGMLVDNKDYLKDIRVIIITGVGKAFVAGADISEMKDCNPEEARSFAQLGMDVFRKIELLEKVFIAAVNGFALGGGCELAMACDLRLAGEKAKFGQPEVSLGITPGFGGTQRLPRLVGNAKAKELILTGRMINALEAEKIGLVNEVVEQDNLMDRAYELANEIIKNSENAVNLSITCINRGMEVDIDSAMLIEKDCFGLCFANDQQKEGMSAFLEKRKPNFNGVQEVSS